MTLKTTGSPWLVAVVAMAALLGLTACSRQEKPKAAEKPPRTIDIAPTPAVATGMVTILRQGGTNSPHYRAPRRSTSTPESRKALAERRRAYQRKMIAEEVLKIEKELDAVSGQMQAVEAGARLSNAVVTASAQSLDRARAAYERDRYALPGMAELKDAREAAKARLAQLRQQEASTPGGQAEAMTKVQDELLKLTRKMYATEMAGRTNSTTLSQSVLALRESESGYQTSLMVIPEFKNLAKKQRELLVVQQDMLEARKKLGPEEK